MSYRCHVCSRTNDSRLVNDFELDYYNGSFVPDKRYPGKHICLDCFVVIRDTILEGSPKMTPEASVQEQFPSYNPFQPIDIDPSYDDDDDLDWDYDDYREEELPFYDYNEEDEEESGDKKW